MTWYQDHEESCSYEDLHHREEIHQPLPVKNKYGYTKFALIGQVSSHYGRLDSYLIDKYKIKE